MRLTNVMKKLVLSLMIVAIVGMFAACSNGSGSSSGDGSNSGSNSLINPNTTYTVLLGYYGENHTGDKEEATGKAILEKIINKYSLVEGDDYVISGTTIRITALGLYKIKPDEWDCYDVMYDNKIVYTIDVPIDNYLGDLEADECTIIIEKRIITLTESGYTKFYNKIKDWN